MALSFMNKGEKVFPCVTVAKKREANFVILSQESTTLVRINARRTATVWRVHGAVCERELDTWVHILAGAITTPEAL